MMLETERNDVEETPSDDWCSPFILWMFVFHEKVRVLETEDALAWARWRLFLLGPWARVSRQWNQCIRVFVNGDHQVLTEWSGRDIPTQLFSMSLHTGQTVRCLARRTGIGGRRCRIIAQHMINCCPVKRGDKSRWPGPARRFFWEVNMQGTQWSFETGRARVKVASFDVQYYVDGTLECIWDLRPDNNRVPHLTAQQTDRCEYQVRSSSLPPIRRSRKILRRWTLQTEVSVPVSGRSNTDMEEVD